MGVNTGLQKGAISWEPQRRGLVLPKFGWRGGQVELSQLSWGGQRVGVCGQGDDGRKRRSLVTSSVRLS